MSAVLVPIGDVKILADYLPLRRSLRSLPSISPPPDCAFRLPELPRPFRAPVLTICRMKRLPLAAIASICLLLVNFDGEIYVAVFGALVLKAAGLLF